MKTVIAIFFIIAMEGCSSTLPIAANPDKATYNSGTIGSVKATDNLPVSDTGIIHSQDTLVHHNYRY